MNDREFDWHELTVLYGYEASEEGTSEQPPCNAEVTVTAVYAFHDLPGCGDGVDVMSVLPRTTLDLIEEAAMEDAESEEED